MTKSHYSKTQIVKILKEVEGERLAKEVCREYGISDATYYNWKAKYANMEASDIKGLKELEEEKRRLKQMYANLSLEHTIMKNIIEKSCKTSCAARTDRLRQGASRRQPAHGLSNRRYQRYCVSLPA